MATFVEEGQDSPEEEVSTYTSLEPQDTVEQPEVEQEPLAQEESDDVPDRYRGKSIKEIARMHQEAEKLIGRQGNDLGELRRIVDDFIKAQTVSKVQAAVSEEEDVDIFSDPTKFVNKAVQNHPEVKQAKELALQMQQQTVMARLKERHPDFMDIAGSSNFQEWVAASKVRTELFARANSYDFDSADELLSTWKERSTKTAQAVQVEQQDRKRQIKAAAAVPTGVSDESPSKPIYRRADIIRLMQTNPDRYDAMQDEIMAAYREGRVK